MTKDNKTALIIGGIGLVVFGRQILSALSVNAHNTQLDNLEKITKDQENKNTVTVWKIYRNKQGKIIKQVKQRVNLETIARIIFDSFYRNDIIGYTENESRAISAINNVPKEYIPKLTAIYLAIYNKQLASDFTKFLNEKQYQGVRAKFM